MIPAGRTFTGEMLTEPTVLTFALLATDANDGEPAHARITAISRQAFTSTGCYFDEKFAGRIIKIDGIEGLCRRR